MLTDCTYSFLNENDILEQKGHRSVSYFCKSQLLTNKMILKNCRINCGNLSTTRIDYRKTFDIVPYSWILNAFELYKISSVVVDFLGYSMWKTTLYLKHTKSTAASNRLNIRREIIKKVSLSLILFCLSLMSLSHQLSRNIYG